MKPRPPDYVTDPWPKTRDAGVTQIISRPVRMNLSHEFTRVRLRPSGPERTRTRARAHRRRSRTVQSRTTARHRESAGCWAWGVQHSKLPGGDIYLPRSPRQYDDLRLRLAGGGVGQDAMTN